LSAPELASKADSFVPARERVLLAGADGEHCGDVIPSREAPKWPRSAERSGLAGGSVVIALDVSERGLPENVRVLEASPAEVFEDAALSAVARWRYCPVIRDGQPAARENVLVRLRFEREA
jgi:protein TonB